MDIIRQTLNLSSGRYTYYKAFHAMLLVPRTYYHPENRASAA